MLNQGYASGGSVQNSIMNGSSGTDAASARAWSEKQAQVAFERQRQLMQEQQAYNSAEAKIARDFNAEEALKARNWETDMANSIYTRSVKNMREAGINPILAANMGLSGASVGSAATASTSGASASMGSAPLAQNFMDSWSAQNSSSHGNSWNSSENGYATGFAALGEALQGLIGGINTAFNLSIDLKDLGDLANQGYEDTKSGAKLIADVANGKVSLGDAIKDTLRKSAINLTNEVEEKTTKSGIPYTDYGDKKWNQKWINPWFPGR